MKLESFALDDAPLPLAPAVATRDWMDATPTGRPTDEPVCMVFPVQAGAVESFEPEMRNLADDPTLAEQALAWKARRDDFMLRFARSDPATLAEAWQKYCYLGKLPDRSDAPADHTRELRPALPVDGRAKR